MIYFVRAGDDGPVKIGVSQNAAKRVDDLKTASPFKLKLLRLIEGGRLQEQALHWEFRDLRLEGEWFRFDERMLIVDPSDIVIGDKEAAAPNEKISEWLDTIGWSARELSQRLRCDTNLPTRWKRGAAATPQSVSKWLEALAEFHQAHPAPTDWRTRKMS